MNIKWLLPLACLLSTALWAAPHPPEKNEDLHYIKNAKIQLIVPELVQSLGLTSDQAAVLVEVATYQNQLREQAKSDAAAVRAQLDAAAQTIRARLEDGAMLSAQDEEILKEYHAQLRDIHHSVREGMRSELEKLRGLLSEEQREAMREFMQSHREDLAILVPRGMRAGGPRQGGPQNRDSAENSAERGERGPKARMVAVRLLLSEPFIAAIRQ